MASSWRTSSAEAPGLSGSVAVSGTVALARGHTDGDPYAFVEVPYTFTRVAAASCQ